MIAMWHAFALAAGCLQTLRNAGAQRLSAHVPAAVNSWARFAFNLPWALACVDLLSLRFPAPALPPAFLPTCAVAGGCQLLANVALVSAFRHTTFARTVMLNRLDVVIAALVGVLAFGELPSARGWLGLLVCLLGSVAINLARTPASALDGPHPLRRVFTLDRGGALALTSATLLVGASFGVKRAVALLAAHNPRLAGHTLLLSAHALLHVTWIEVALLSAGLLLRDRRALHAVPAHLGTMGAVGLAAFAASLCWYTAYASGLVAYVSAVGQIEGVLSVAIGLWVFRERATLRQLPGAALIGFGVLLLVLP